MIGQTISHYKILEKLGEGGMGVVYKAQDTKLNRVVALKFLPHGLHANEAERSRFQQEAQAASALNHSNICTIHDISEEGEQQFIVMEFVDGKTLREMIPLQKTQGAIDYAIQIGEALQEAHSKGIVHRDIKTDNIMVNSKNQIKVLDFGLAKLKGSLRLTKTLSTVGTLAYMAPEQIQGGEVDARSDIFSFGVVLYEMLTGHVPFRGEHEAAMLYSIVNEEPQPLSDFRKDIPSNIASIVLKVLQKNPLSRYQTMQEVISDLKNAPAIQLLKQEKSIVVLPFENLSPDADQEYFSDGLTEEVISDLSAVRSIRVISRSSAMTFKGTKKKIPEIAREVNVQYVLEGSVRKAGNNLRITAQLIEAITDAHVWADKYSGTLDDVFDIQEKVSRSIVVALELALLHEEGERIAKRYTNSLEAYNMYLKGRYFWNKRGEQGFRRAIEYFEQAIREDSSYSLAHAGLADCYSLLPWYSNFPPKEAYLKAKSAALNALEADNSVSEAHNSLAFAITFYDWDWEGAEREFKRAIALNPRNAHAHHWYANYLSCMADSAQALAEIARARELDPLSLIINQDTGYMFYYAHRYDEAIEALQKTIEMDPNFICTHLCLGWAYLQKSMCESALEELQKELALSTGYRELVESWIGVTYALMNRKEESLQVLEGLIERSKETYISPYLFAIQYSSLENDDRAFQCLERAMEERHINICFLKVDPILDRLRSDTRFTDLLRKMRLAH